MPPTEPRSPIELTETFPPDWEIPPAGEGWSDGPRPLAVLNSREEKTLADGTLSSKASAILWGGCLADGTSVAQVTWGSGSISARWTADSAWRLEERLSGAAAPSEHRAAINRVWSDMLDVQRTATERVMAEWRSLGLPPLPTDEAER